MLLITNGLLIPSEVWHAHSLGRLGLVFGVTAAFAVLGYVVGGVSRSGAAAGAGVCFALFWGAGPGAFLGLLSVFGLTWAATRTGLAAKTSRGIEEHRGGRSASQVLANVGVAAVAALIFAVTRERRMLLVMTAALSEPAADTVSSECGQVFSERVYLISSFERVPAGTDGGVSVAGTMSGVLASFGVSVVGVWACGLTGGWVWGATAAGILGMVADSFLGALLERRGLLGNDAVNLLGTMVAAIAAAGFALL